MNPTAFIVAITGAALLSAQARTPGVASFDTGLTITKVRTAQTDNTPLIVASSYEGTVLGMKTDGTVLWENGLSGFMNEDLWCGDITGDGFDEILAANADGSIYCLDAEGTLLWKFKANDAPMYAVCVVHQGGNPYVVCGGYDLNVYYLSPQGEIVKTLPSSGYSISKPWGESGPPQERHVANFLRAIPQADGSDVLAIHGMMNGMQDKGVVYLFKPLADKPFSTTQVKAKSPIGEFRVCQADGKTEIVMGISSMIQEAALLTFDPQTAGQRSFSIPQLGKKLDNFGYRVVQPEIIPDGSGYQYFVLFGSRILLIPPSLDAKSTDVLACKYAFNDMWKYGSKIILASAQSGGSCIHILDLENPNWKEDYQNLTPPGKISAILKNSTTVRDQLKTFKRPRWERDPRPVYLMSESRRGVEDLISDIRTQSGSPVFLNGFHMGTAEKWDRSAIENKKYKNRRDRRRKYNLTQQQVLDTIVPHFDNEPGIAYWAGHGNDPFMFQLETTEKVISAANGKKTVLIFPELEDHTTEFDYVMDNLLYPLAQYAQGKNANLYVRTKNIFWLGNAYLPVWNRLLSGEFSDVFAPSMEETTDKSMELSLAARTGIWASGAVDQWGARCARDNPSFDRARQHSHQMLPNHFLRMMIFHISNGAQYIDNFAVDQNYMSLLWELIAKGALYVPERSEIVSYSPVHLAMKAPDARFLNEGSNVKWCTFFDQKAEDENPMVFSHLNGSWPGAPVTEWDFSRYAAGVKDRRLNFLAPYANGLVLITPPQDGVFADKDAPRGAMADHLNPIYHSILKEYITDGRNYTSADGTQTYAANDYYKTIEADIQESAKLLPLTVSGDVAWVCAQTAPDHLRLTLIDSGYINPSAKTATVTFHSVIPEKMTDLLSKKTFSPADPMAVQIDIPCGLFRFIDIELTQPLTGK